MELVFEQLDIVQLVTSKRIKHEVDSSLTVPVNSHRKSTLAMMIRLQKHVLEVNLGIHEQLQQVFQGAEVIAMLVEDSRTVYSVQKSVWVRVAIIECIFLRSLVKNEREVRVSQIHLVSYHQMLQIYGEPRAHIHIRDKRFLI